jgi:hypothetical protein
MTSSKRADLRRLEQRPGREEDDELEWLVENDAGFWGYREWKVGWSFFSQIG